MEEKLTESKKFHAIQFGRWLLLHAEAYLTKDFLVTWIYKEKEMNTEELYKEFLQDA